VVELEYTPASEGSTTHFSGITAKIRRNRALVQGDLITFSVPWKMTHNETVRHPKARNLLSLLSRIQRLVTCCLAPLDMPLKNSPTPEH